MKWALALVLVPVVAHADDLGAPLPEPAAEPAMAGISPYVMSVDIDDVAKLPMTNTSAVLGGFGVRVYAGGAHPGLFGFYSMGGGFGFGSGVRMFSIEVPSPGLGYRTRDWLFGVQLVPAIQWFTQGAMRDHDYTLATDVQLCLQYNIAGVFPKNSAACVYVAPSVYRDGWLQGASAGIRLFTL
jgi:hypothetical protein